MNMRPDRISASVLMYSPDTVGLGHMRRNTAIAAGIAERVPGVSNLLIVGSSAGPYFDLPPGTDCVKLPSLMKTGRDTWQPKSLNIANRTALELRSRIIMETAAAFSPDVFLVDHVPAGIWGELTATLRMLKDAPRPPRIVLGLRDILGAPEDIRASWSRDGVYDLIEDCYDDILIYGSRDLYPTCELYGLRPRFADRIRYCGYVCLDREAPAKAAARERLGQSDRPLVLVTAGGGHDAFPMMSFVLEALAGKPTPLPFDLTMITGPLMPLAERRRIEKMACRLPVRLIASTSELPVHLSAADLVITMGGYNTVMEALRTGTPAIVVPRIGPSAEQRIRAALFDDLGLLSSIDLATGAPERLAAMIKTALASERRPQLSLRFDGLENAARLLSDMLAFAAIDAPLDTGWREPESLVA